MADTSAWPFGDDADRNDPLTARRIAVTSSHPRWTYLVAFDRESEARPTDAEAAMLASYLEEYQTRWYNSSFLARMAEKALDVDGGANGVIFHKWGPDDWGYRRRSYDRGYLFTFPGPGLRGTEHAQGWPDGGQPLLAVLDRLHAIGSEPRSTWTAWKAAHPDVFGSEEADDA